MVNPALERKIEEYSSRFLGIWLAGKLRRIAQWVDDILWRAVRRIAKLMVEIENEVNSEDSDTDF